MDDSLDKIQARHMSADADRPGTLLWLKQHGLNAHTDRAVLLATISTLRSEVAELREALEPFAEVARTLSAHYVSIGKPEDESKSFPDDARIVLLSSANALRICHLRRAASVLAKHKG